MAGGLLEARAAIEVPVTPFTPFTPFGGRGRPNVAAGIWDLIGSPPRCISVFRFGCDCGTVQDCLVSNVGGGGPRSLVLPLCMRLVPWGTPAIGGRALCCESVISWRHIVAPVAAVGAAVAAWTRGGRIPDLRALSRVSQRPFHQGASSTQRSGESETYRWVLGRLHVERAHARNDKVHKQVGREEQRSWRG